MNHLPPTTIDTTKPFVDIYAKEDEPQELTLAQLARRKQMAIILCANAQNETSHILAKRICKSWFTTCDTCPYRKVGEN